MPTSITIKDNNSNTRTTLFLTKEVYKYLNENPDFLFEDQILDKSTIEKKYDELKRVDETALRFNNLENTGKQDPSFLAAYNEIKGLYEKNPIMFSKKLLKGLSSKYCLKISCGDESADILKLPNEEKLHAFILEELYELMNKEKVSIKFAKEFLDRSSGPYRVHTIFEY